MIFRNVFQRQKCWQKRKKLRQKDVEAKGEIVYKSVFNSFKYVIDQGKVRFFFLISLQTGSHPLNYVNSLHYSVWFLLYYLLHIFRSYPFAALTILWPYKYFIWIYGFLKNHTRSTLIRNVNLSNLENALQRNLGSSKAKECNFRAAGSRNFRNLHVTVPTIVASTVIYQR